MIRPVLDLSDLEAGSRKLDTLFSREYALQIQNAGYSRNQLDGISSLTDTLRDGLSSGDDPIVGKTAVVEGLAQRIVRGDVPEGLKDRKLFALDMGALVGEITPAIDQELGDRANWRGRNM